MKNIKWLSGAFIMALGLLFFGACSDDDEKAKPIFPEKQAIDCTAGEVKTLTFHAENAWTLASSRLWCKFKDGNDAVSSLSGGPGEQTVKITVTEDVWEFEDAVADIIMGMEGQTQAIAVVNRAAKGYKAEAYRMIGQDKVLYNASNPAVVPYIGDVEISFEANFDWKLDNCPEWLKVSSKVNYEERTMMGNAGQMTSWLLEFNPTAEYSKGPEQNLALKFVDSYGALRLEVPLKYVGIAEDKVEFSIKAFNWVFSADAAKYWEGGVNGTPGEEKPAPMTFSAITKSGFKIAYLERGEHYDYRLVKEEDSWFYADVNDAKITIYPTINNTDSKRYGDLAVVPLKVYDELLNKNFENMFDENGGLKYQFENYLFDFAQEGKQNASAFDVKDDVAGASLNAKLTDISKDFGEQYNTSIVYRLNLEASKSYESITITSKDYPTSNILIDVKNLWENVGYEVVGKGQFSVFSISDGEKYPDMEFYLMNGDEVYAVLIITQF